MEAYRYGFNGMERDDNVKGRGNSYDFGARLYDPRVGRWLSIDPLAMKYPDLSPYNFVANSPILFVDTDGEVIIINYLDKNGKEKSFTYKPGIKPSVDNEFVQNVHKAVSYVMQNDGNNTFQNISNSSEVVKINEIFLHNDNTKGKINDTHTKVENVTISWNPFVALKTTNGGAISPATALLHEAGHAERYIEANTKAKIQALEVDLKNDGTVYDNPEEKRVFDKIETPYVTKTNKNQPNDLYMTPQQEGTRQDHRGTTYLSKGVTSIVPAGSVEVEGLSQPVDPVPFQAPAVSTGVNNLILH